MKLEGDLNRIFFTSDHHFGHANIIKYSQRPFDGIQEMDQALIENWNAVVQADDLVFHLGDFTFHQNASRYFGALNGRIYILKLEWHHDHRWLEHESHKQLLSKSGHVVQFLPALTVLSCAKLGDGKYPLPITISHYPLAEWEASHHGAWQLHGHSHGQYLDPNNRKCLDVGVDAMKFQPVSLERIRILMLTRG
jgi:calcineurin-like phosphoesterase family protein